LNWLEFIASIVNSLAWPVGILAIVLVLRKPLRQLLPLLRRLKYKEFELEFEKRVQEIRAEVTAAVPASVAEAQATPVSGALAQLAHVSPGAAVIESWRDVEAAGLGAARRLGGDRFRDNTLTYEAIRHLEQSDELDSGVVGLLRDLRGLRNEAAHAPDFALSEESALGYADAAERVASYLREMAGDA